MLQSGVRDGRLLTTETKTEEMLKKGTLNMSLREGEPLFMFAFIYLS